jgi:hypothetical protein
MKFKINPRIETILAAKYPELAETPPRPSRLKALAKMIIEASNAYIEHPDDQTPWGSSPMQVAQWVYFLPLNNIRVQGVLSRLRALPDDSSFFEGLENLVDFGAGLGALPYELESVNPWKSINLIDSEELPRSELQKQFPKAQIFSSMRSFLGLQNKKLPAHTLLTFSYSLTENSTQNQHPSDLLPAEAYQAEALLILEPSTQKDGRRLSEIRQELIQRGFYVWAPCLHQHSCPLLHQSHRDWCHDRFHFQPPPWFLELEKQLPMKNATVTTSYLAARKAPPPNSNSISKKGRLIGDFLNEKGKSRQLICRGPEREFLTWLHREVEPQEFPRGEILSLPNKFEKVSNEIRVQEPILLRTNTTPTTTKNS